MYKVGEAADMIGVEKVEIFEKMITHRTLLDPNIKKIDGVTYFEEQAITILKTLFNGSSLNSAHTDVVEHSEKSQIEKRVVKVRSKFERERDILYDKINILKYEIGNLDEALKMKDDQIFSFQEKLIDDLDVINRLQAQISKKA